MRHPLLSASCITGALMALSTTAFSAAAPWTTYQGNALHTGYVPLTLDPSTFKKTWSVTVGAASLDQVTEEDGLIFLSQTGYFSDQGVYVLKAANGSVVWTLAYPDVFSVNPPAYDNGNIYFETVDNYGNTWMWGYEAAAEQLIFKSAVAAQWENYLAPTIVDHTVYAEGGSYGGMYSFNGANGTQNWFTGLQQYDTWTPSVDATYAYTYLGGYFDILNRTTGAVVKEIADPGYIWNGYTMNEAPAIGSQNDAIVFNGGRLISFNLSTQTIRWIQTAGFSAQSSIANGTIYVVNNGTLSARNETTGAQSWVWAPPSGNLTGPVIVTDSHVFATTGTTTYAIDLTTHAAVWSYAAGGALSLSEGQLYIAGTTGQLTAITVASAPAGGADVAIQLTSPHGLTVGAPAAFVATTTNAGPATANSVVVGFRLPSSFTVESLSSGCTESLGTIVCTYPTLVAGSTLTTQFTVVPARAGPAIVMSSATSATTDPATDNNTQVSPVFIK